MSSSVYDLAIKVISNNEIKYYASHHSFGLILWNIEFGMFDKENPVFEDFLSCIEDQDCLEEILERDEPLMEPLLGYMTIDFDKKIIIEEHYQDKFTHMDIDLFHDTIRSYLFHYLLIFSYATIKFHVEKTNFSFLNVFNEEIVMDIPRSVEKLHELLNQLKTENYKNIAWVRLNLPTHWTHTYNNEIMSNKLIE